MRMLEKFHDAKRPEIYRLLKNLESGDWKPPKKLYRPGLGNHLRSYGKDIAIIAEYKRASPSRGIINDKLTVANVISSYEENHAAAFSILTEEKYFKGSFKFLEQAWQILNNKNIPILRKDFIFHPCQILQTAYSHASAVLIIVRAIPSAAKLQELQDEAKKWGLECVMEVFDEKDLLLARETGAEIIQVNARDLDTLQVSRTNCTNLIRKFPPQKNEVWIAASGIESPVHLREAAEAGFQACLIGSSLMQSANPGQALKELFCHADKILRPQNCN